MNAKKYTKERNLIEPLAEDIVREIVAFHLDRAPNETQRHNIKVIIADALVKHLEITRACMTALEAALSAFIASVDSDDVSVSDMEKAYEQARAVLKEQVTG